MKKSGKQKREGFMNKAKNNVDDIRSSVVKRAGAVKDSVDDTAHKTSNSIKVVHRKTEGAIKSIQDGGHDTKKDIHRTVKKLNNL